MAANVRVGNSNFQLKASEVPDPNCLTSSCTCEMCPPGSRCSPAQNQHFSPHCTHPTANRDLKAPAETSEYPFWLLSTRRRLLSLQLLVTIIQLLFMLIYVNRIRILTYSTGYSTELMRSGNEPNLSDILLILISKQATKFSVHLLR